jgi:hypothetical protein
MVSIILVLGFHLDGVHKKKGDGRVGLGIWVQCNGASGSTQKDLLESCRNVISVNFWSY